MFSNYYSYRDFFILPCPLSAQGDYIIGPEDVIEIIVWDHDDLRRTLSVSLEGKISFPLIGEVMASEKTTQQLEKDIAKLLGDGYIVHPQVSVTVREYKSRYVFVMGEVNNPGTYPVSKENTLLFILSQAGGATRDAGEEVVIIRPKNRSPRGITLKEAELKREEIIKVNLKDVLSGDIKHNVIIREGDSIVVPKMSYFFVMGEVKKPGKYNLDRGTTVLMAISIGGGLTQKAAPSRTKIIREERGERTDFEVKMGTLIQPGDTIVVPERFF
ncbi:MAG: SLBB domain-containing protein [Thermodesulfobacteriota bacterium]|nr:SLBB domain-containing protein [Thermodesulfobacteriota bacterium]